jgi:hypothetical protein
MTNTIYKKLLKNIFCLGGEIIIQFSRMKSIPKKKKRKLSGLIDTHCAEDALASLFEFKDSEIIAALSTLKRGQELVHLAHREIEFKSNQVDKQQLPTERWRRCCCHRYGVFVPTEGLLAVNTYNHNNKNNVC